MTTTKEQARQKFHAADNQLYGCEEILTPENQQIIQEAEDAAEELIQAEEAFEQALGTPKENAALTRLTKARAILPIRKRLAEPILEIISDHTSPHETTRGRLLQREAVRELGYLFSVELLEGLDCASVLQGLQLSYAFRSHTTSTPISWPEWLEMAFPAPKKEGAMLMAQEVERRLKRFLADSEVEVAS
jgi:hypothetical protein